ncbi:hypothetical protein JMJ77_0011456 [Colletotrichum scovillei]|uniref:Uncharacterized protein n=1 Tax=Colletotrichum scovillei TaxID=1209932 RepID=A0A9P7QPX1_9PEZI|nr:hypothetical protein JMJ78_0008148 [Colletotrichum scovillei]KAG7040594.1 hypothetical protein JMJ77_0011456 [Colletotrichum scovillei]KAG7060643.1 hypothetical protein JMJ76_0012214 [Colletotrichum scovillei]
MIKLQQSLPVAGVSITGSSVNILNLQEHTHPATILLYFNGNCPDMHPKPKYGAFSITSEYCQSLVQLSQCLPFPML